MNDSRFNALLDGDQPSFEDFAGFVAVVEKLPGELLWRMLNTSPKLNGHLRKVVVSSLQKKVQRLNVDTAIDAIVTGVMARN
jgi:hypothetical protein